MNRRKVLKAFGAVIAAPAALVGREVRDRNANGPEPNQQVRRSFDPPRQGCPWAATPKFTPGQWVIRKGSGVHRVMKCYGGGIYVLDRCSGGVSEEELELTATICMAVLWPVEKEDIGDALAATSEADALARLRQWLEQRVGGYEPIDTRRITWQRWQTRLHYQRRHVVLMTYEFPEEPV